LDILKQVPKVRKAINNFRVFKSSSLNRNTSDKNQKSKSKNKILKDRLYLDRVKFLNNNPITENSKILIERYLNKLVDVLLSEPESISNKQTKPKQFFIINEILNPL
jgi:hypothetical protein